jgi:serine/threonine protein kinase
MEDLTGKQLGPYQIVAPLGEGGMAAVFRAYQPAMERYVALKVLPRHFADDPRFAARFQREARLLAQLQHPHILPVFDYGQAEGYSYIVMPFVPSGTLTDSMQGKPLPLPRIRQVISQVGDGLNYAHDRGMVHRDVKPSNILIDESGNCLLTDFGLARMVETSVNLTATGTVMGTPAYMAPEQGSGHKIDARSDIYSLGIILYEMATGRVPYRAETPIAVVYMHISSPLPLPRSVNPDLPEAVERVILKALAKNPDERYQTAQELVAALNRAIDETPTVTSVSEIPPTTEATFVGVASTLVAPMEEPAGMAIEPLTPKRRLPGWALALAVGVVVLLAAGGIILASRANKPLVTAVALVSPNPTASALALVPRPASSPTPRPAPTKIAPTPYRARFWMTTSSDWTTLRVVSGAEWSPKVVWASAEASRAEYEGGLLWLTMPVDQAQAGQSVRMLVEVSLSGLKKDGAIVFEIDRGHLGSTQVEVLNNLMETPVSIGVYEWAKIKPTPPNTYTFEVPTGSLIELRQVSVDLGATNVSNGLTQVGDQIGDGITAPANVGGKEARVTVANGAQTRYIYFQVDDTFLQARNAHVSITIEYFDQGKAPDFEFLVNYDSGGTGLASCYKRTRHIGLTNSGQWKTATFDLPDAYLGGCENYDADFRIETPDRDLFFNTLTVTKK